MQPEACFPQIVSALRALADRAADSGVSIGLENEHACNLATGAEAAPLLAEVDHPNLKLIWDPANALVSGESPYPEGYQRVPAARIVHVHAKDCTVEGHTPAWCELGKGAVDWPGQVAALRSDGYRGWISLETHWAGPGGDKLRGSMICARNLQALSA